MNYRKLASKQDKRVSKKSGFNIQLNSGAMAGRKGDLIGYNILTETKTVETPRKTFQIKREWLDKIALQAFEMGKELGILIFSFGDSEDFVCLRSEDFYKLYEIYKISELAKMDTLTKKIMGAVEDEDQ